MVMNSFGNRNFMQPMGRLNMHSKCLVFFLKVFFGGGGGRIFFLFTFVPNMFLSSSHQVPNVFPLAPRFNPICFAQSPPLLTYIGGQKGEALHLSRESLFLGSLHSFNFFLRWANQIGSLRKKKRVGLVRINFKLVYVESQSASLKVLPNLSSLEVF